MLASAVWGVTFGLLAGSRGVRWYRLGAAAGLALGAMIGFCRVVQDAHTPIEVVAGWFLDTMEGASESKLPGVKRGF
jgi:membrane-associated phospholipid phosphatase